MSAALWQVWAWADEASTDAPSNSSHSHRRQRRRFRSVGSEAIPKGKASAGILRAVKTEDSLNACKGDTCNRTLVIVTQEMRSSGVLQAVVKSDRATVAAAP